MTTGRLERCAAGLARGEDALLVVLLALALGLAVTQILLRNLAGTGIAWADPLVRVLVLWLGLAGALVATRHREHIAIDLAARYLGPRARRGCRVVTDLFSAAVCGALAWHGARFVHLDWVAGTTAFAGVPAWICELVIPLGFGLIAVRFLVNAVIPAAAPQAPP